MQTRINRPFHRILSLLPFVLFSLACSQAQVPPTQAEVIVYGGTPAGIMAAVAAARHGHSVILIDINNHLGGVVSGGLTVTDIGDPRTVGGLAAEFLNRIAAYYSTSFGANSPQFFECKAGKRFEPKIAELIFTEMVKEQGSRITVWKHCRFNSATVAGGIVTSLTANSLKDNTVRTFTGKVFIDASYEGDLMAGVNVPYRVGREAPTEYGESLAGVRVGPNKGQGDGLVMAYNYRLCLTPAPGTYHLFPKPVVYNRAMWQDTFEARILSGQITDFGKYLFPTITNPLLDGNPNAKYDLNSSDMVGESYGYPDGDWATRDAIAAAQRDYILSELYYLQTDPGLTHDWRVTAKAWGFPNDEFSDNQGFPFQLYIREARRMVGQYVLTQNDLTQDRYKPDGICDGSHGIDCHVIQYVNVGGKSLADATPHVGLNDYDIPYSCLSPKTQPTNLLVPVCLSATHVAICSVRMEPVYMMLGHAAGDAAHLALTGKIAVQSVNTKALRQLLLSESAILDDGYAPHLRISFTPTHPQPGQLVQFQAHLGTLKSPLINMSWDMEGVGAIDASGLTATHTFSLAKIYHVSLVVADQAGHHRMVYADVPVGAATPLDVTQDDMDADRTGKWDASYPELSGHNSDVFIEAGISYAKLKNGVVPVAAATFHPPLPKAGMYQICFGYRPAADQASNLVVTITNHGQVTTRMINERAKTSPFPFVSLGQFSCLAGVDSTVTLNSTNANGTVAVDAVRWVWAGN